MYLLKISVTHNKKRIPSLNLFIICISDRSAPQILSIKDEYTVLVLSFLIISLCYSLPNSLFDILSFLIPLLEVFLSKNLENIEASPC